MYIMVPNDGAILQGAILQYALLKNCDLFCSEDPANTILLFYIKHTLPGYSAVVGSVSNTFVLYWRCFPP